MMKQKNSDNVAEVQARIQFVSTLRQISATCETLSSEESCKSLNTLQSNAETASVIRRFWLETIENAKSFCEQYQHTTAADVGGVKGKFDSIKKCLFDLDDMIAQDRNELVRLGDRRDEFSSVYGCLKETLGGMTPSEPMKVGDIVTYDSASTGKPYVGEVLGFEGSRVRLWGGRQPERIRCRPATEPEKEKYYLTTPQIGDEVTYTSRSLGKSIIGTVVEIVEDNYFRLDNEFEVPILGCTKYVSSEEMHSLSQTVIFGSATDAASRAPHSSTFGPGRSTINGRNSEDTSVPPRTETQMSR